jgi:predicted nucleotidyltransferase
MNTEDVLSILRHNRAALRARAARRAALFGSVARGENRPGSDIDIMIEIEPAADIGVFEYAGIKQYIASLFDGPVECREPGQSQAFHPSGRGRRCLCLLIKPTLPFAISSITSISRVASSPARTAMRSSTTLRPSMR